MTFDEATHTGNRSAAITKPHERRSVATTIAKSSSTMLCSSLSDYSNYIGAGNQCNYWLVVNSPYASHVTRRLNLGARQIEPGRSCRGCSIRSHANSLAASAV